MRFFGVDAFTTDAFRGNPAVVCLLDHRTHDDRLQQLAAEFNQPATAFLHTDDRGRELRWFTPTVELPMCGHGTLATAHILYETADVGGDEVVPFRTPNAELVVRQEDGRIWMDFPASHVEKAPVPDVLLDCLGAEEVTWFGRNDHEFVVVLDSPQQVGKIQPDFARVAQLPVNRVIVTARGGTGADFTSRVFVPAFGINEDYVTGSAHSVLGPLWAERLGRSRMTAVQASSRGGELAVVVGDDGVRLGGQAITTSRGKLLI
jgi:predicted PhzF superfamily epimerase YddE/YHI9